MKFCISEITTMYTQLPADLRAYSNAGWQAVELDLGKVETYLKNHTTEDLSDELSKYGLKPVAAIGVAPSDAGMLLARGSAFSRYLERLKHQLDLCQALGIPSLGVGADPARFADADWFSGAVLNLRTAGEICEEYQIRIGVEFMSLAPPIGPFILESLVETRELVDAVDHLKIGINLDLFHFHRGGGRIADIGNLLPHRLVHVHFCDVLGLPLEELEDKHRVLPGEGVMALKDIIEALRASGYEGYLSVELLNEDLWKDDPEDAAKKCRIAVEQLH